MDLKTYPYTKEYTWEEIEKETEKVFGEEEESSENYPIEEWEGSNGIKISFHPKPKTRRCKRNVRYEKD